MTIGDLITENIAKTGENIVIKRFVRWILEKQALKNKMEAPKYKRILLKISGEALIGKSDYGIDPDIMNNIAEQVKEVVELGVEMAVVIGEAISGAVSLQVQAEWTVQPQTI